METLLPSPPSTPPESGFPHPPGWAREAIAAGIGFGVVLDGEIGEDPRLLAVPIEAPAIGGGVYAVALPESLELPAVRAFLGAPGA